MPSILDKLSRYSGLAVIALFLFAACGADRGPEPETEPEITAPPPPVTNEKTDPSEVLEFQGIDVSHFQNTVDWEAVASTGKKFAVIKATEGIDLLDPTYATNWKGAKAAGLVRGAYHFFEPEDDPTTQAEFFMANVELMPGDLVPILDAETSKGIDAATLQANLKTWLETVETAYGVTPILYTDTNFATEYLSTGFGKYPLWIAEYEETAPTNVGSWIAWTLWQYSQDGQLDGVEVGVDLSVFRGTRGQWEGLLIPHAKIGPTGSVDR